MKTTLSRKEFERARLAEKEERKLMEKKCHHTWVSNSGQGGPPDYRLNRRMGKEPVMHIKCLKCGDRTWVAKAQWEWTTMRPKGLMNELLVPKDEKWVMHVIGPDEMHFMPDELTALREANKLNKKIVKWRNDDPSPHDPFMVALAKNMAIEEG